MAAENENLSCTPPELRKSALGAIERLLPTKSKPKYEKEYSIFMSWCRENSVQKVTENVLLAYYQRLSEQNKKSSTLWTSYSMLRACLNVHENLDISQFARLQAFLKRQSEGYVPKKSKILEAQDIDRFLNEADDTLYLAIKVSLLFK